MKLEDKYLKWAFNIPQFKIKHKHNAERDGRYKKTNMKILNEALAPRI